MAAGADSRGRAPRSASSSSRPSSRSAPTNGCDASKTARAASFHLATTVSDIQRHACVLWCAICCAGGEVGRAARAGPVPWPPVMCVWMSFAVQRPTRACLPPLCDPVSLPSLCTPLLDAQPRPPHSTRKLCPRPRSTQPLTAWQASRARLCFWTDAPQVGGGLGGRRTGMMARTRVWPTGLRRCSAKGCPGARPRSTSPLTATTVSPTRTFPSAPDPAPLHTLPRQASHAPRSAWRCGAEGDRGGGG